MIQADAVFKPEDLVEAFSRPAKTPHDVEVSREWLHAEGFLALEPAGLVWTFPGVESVMQRRKK
jgi:hypothetical protein